MARKRRTRKYYRKKGRWSANINNINSVQRFEPGTNYLAVTLQSNPAQNQATVSQQYTVKNVELSYEIEVTANNAARGIENLQGYIIYVPQGMIITETLPYNHPEYIMAYRWLGSPNYEDGNNPENVGRNPMFIKSRLSRRLQTGDSIVFLVIGTNDFEVNLDVSIRGLVRYWTKAN